MLELSLVLVLALVLILVLVLVLALVLVPVPVPVPALVLVLVLALAGGRSSKKNRHTMVGRVIMWQDHLTRDSGEAEIGEKMDFPSDSS